MARVVVCLAAGRQIFPAPNEPTFQLQEQVQVRLGSGTRHMIESPECIKTVILTIFRLPSAAEARCVGRPAPGWAGYCLGDAAAWIQAHWHRLRHATPSQQQRRYYDFGPLGRLLYRQRCGCVAMSVEPRPCSRACDMARQLLFAMRQPILEKQRGMNV